MTALLRPATLTDALALLAAAEVRVLAGGTDLYPATQAPDLAGRLVDVAGLPELRGITTQACGALRIGACTTWTEIARAPLPPALRALQQAARLVGGPQIQNAGTLGGNLCTASPAADGVPPLLAVDAQVALAGPGGVRQMPLAAFLTGPRRTALAPGEMLVAVIVPPAGLLGRSAFLKLGARAYLVISIVMVAARLVIADGKVASAMVAVGSAAPTARRLPLVEAALIGAPVDQVAERVDPAAVAAALDPIDDIRGSAAYRNDVAAELVCRTLADLAGHAA